MCARPIPQPPSGGCELKRRNIRLDLHKGCQPPSGGCELKLFLRKTIMKFMTQPPSGGCELKRDLERNVRSANSPAAFGRL